MIRFLLPFLVFILFIGESIFVDLISPEQWGNERIFVPRFLLVVLIMIGIFLKRTQAVYYGIIFGLVFDIIYTDIIGVYLFLFPVMAYIMSLVIKVLHTNLFVVLFISLIGVSGLELFVYGIYSLIGLYQMPWEMFLTHRLFPTVILNGVFTVIIYYPLQKLLLKIYDIKNQE